MSKVVCDWWFLTCCNTYLKWQTANFLVLTNVRDHQFSPRNEGVACVTLWCILRRIFNWRQECRNEHKVLFYLILFFYSNGLLDPWSSGGILRSISGSVVSILIPEGAHHLDLRGSNPKDPVTVINARKIEKQFIKKWIGQANKRLKKTYGPDVQNFIY